MPGQYQTAAINWTSFSTALASAADYFYVPNTTPRPALAPLRSVYVGYRAIASAMSSTDDKDFHAIPACNANTYNEWRATLITFLYSKDLEEYLQKDPTLLKNEEERKNSKHCYSYMYRTCSSTTRASLPASCQPKFDSTPPRTDLLWQHLANSFSSTVGSRQAALFQALYCAQVQEGQDPLPVLSRMISFRTPSSPMRSPLRSLSPGSSKSKLCGPAIR